MARINPSAVGRAGLSSTPIWEGEEKASETFKLGALLINSSGFLTEASADPDNLIGVAVRAGQNGTSNGDKRSRFVPCLPHIIFNMSIDDASDLGNGAYVDADMWKDYGVAKDSDGKWYVDKSETTTKLVKIVGLSDPAARAAADAAAARIQAVVQVIFLGDKTGYDS